MKQFALPKKMEHKGKEQSRKKQGNKSKYKPITASIDYILQLQQTIGNQAVQRMIKSGEIQLKTNHIQPGDVYSREVEQLKQRVESQFKRMDEEDQEVAAEGTSKETKSRVATPPATVVAPLAPVGTPPVQAVLPSQLQPTVSQEQVAQVRRRIAQLVANYAADRGMLGGMVGRGNIVYRNQQRENLVALNNSLIAGQAAARVLRLRGAALVPGRTREAGYRGLLADVRQAFSTQRRFRLRLNDQRALPLNPTINAGVTALEDAGARELVAAINTWSNGDGGAIAGTVFVLPPFAAHPADPRWEVRVPPIPGWVGADPFAHPRNVIGNGSIPTTAHTRRNLPRARQTLITTMNRAGYT